MSTGTGDALYGVVEEYSALGAHHRTGTAEDRATIDWFAGRLRALGAAVELQGWDFPRYDADWEVHVGGEAVQSIPLFYEGVGRVDTDAPHIARLDPAAGGLADFSRFADQALARRAPAAVVSTRAPGGRLFAINRAPVPGSGLPTLCVAGAAGEGLDAGPVHVRMSARLLPGWSENVVGRIGAGPDEKRLVLATPLSGWFRCAGERGTGIALCLEVARRLAGAAPLLVLGLSGHELHYLGAQEFGRRLPLRPRAAFHFGASVAAGEPGEGDALVLTSRLSVKAAGPAATIERVAGAFAALDREVVTVPPARAADPPAWTGEATVWCRWGVPLVSMAGGFPLFHTPDDVPELATAPALLERSLGAALEAAEALAC